MTTTQITGTGPEGETGPVPAKTSTPLPDQARNFLTYIADCDRRIKELEESKATARRIVEGLLGDNEIGLLDGRPVVRWSYITSTRLDSTKLKTEDPETYARYCRPSMSRRFTLVTDEQP